MSSKHKEALSEILELIDKWRTDGVMEHWQYSQLFDIADNALGEPLKNCEVGTEEEQKQRFDIFCSRGNCDNCPFMEEGLWSNCAIRWAQMPYEEEE